MLRWRTAPTAPKISRSRRSVVLHNVPSHTTVAGVPAKIVSVSQKSEPYRDMDQILGQLAYDSFTCNI